MRCRFSRFATLSLCLILGLSACDSTAVDPTPESPPITGPRVASLQIAPASVYLLPGRERSLAVDARDSLGQPIADPVVTWRSDAPAVTSVDVTGRVRAIAPGSARITATVTGRSGLLTAQAMVTVTSSTPDIATWRTARAGLSDVTFLGAWDDGVGTAYVGGQDGGLLRQRDGGAWEVIPLGVTETIVGIWGASPSDIWLVGTNGLVLRGDGATFRRVDVGVSSTFLEVWGLGPDEVYLVGDRGTIVRWNGSRFDIQPTGLTDELWGIWGPNSSTLFAVGNNGAILRFDGVNWRRLNSPDATPYFDVWGTSAGNVFAVGVDGVIVRFDGVQWTRMTTPDRVNLFGIRGRAFNDVYAVGNNGAAWHFDGTTWRAMDIANGQNLRAIAVRPNGSVRLAGWYGTVVSVRGVGVAATIAVDLTDPPLIAAFGTSGSPMFAVGFGSSVFRRSTAGSWQLERVPATYDLYGISGSGPTDIVAVGDTGAILRFDGTTWRRDVSPTRGVLRAIWSGGGQYFVVGERGLVLRSSGTGWTPLSSGTQRFLRAVWGTDPANVFAVGDSGTVLRFDGGRWQPMAAPTTSRLRAIWGSGPTDVFAVGDSGTALRYDGATWASLPSPTTRDLRAVWGRGPTEVYAAGDSGTVVRYDGNTWRPIAAPWRSIMYAFAPIPGTNALAIVGQGGRIFEGVP